MKKVILLFLFLFSLIGNAQSLDSVFVKANKLYQQERYLEALKLYKEIDSSNMESSGLYYNMANIYYKTNQIAPAIYNYEKALQLDPSNKDIAINLSFAQQMCLDNIEELPKTILQKFRDHYVLKYTYNTWAKITIVFAFLAALLFLLYHFSYGTNTKRFYFITSILTVVLVLISIFLTMQNYQFVKSNKPAIVFAIQSQVNSAPVKTSEVNFLLHEGTKVNILESIDTWKKIQIADGKTGWMQSEDLKEY